MLKITPNPIGVIGLVTLFYMFLSLSFMGIVLFIFYISYNYDSFELVGNYFADKRSHFLSFEFLKDFLVWVEQDLGPWGPVAL